MERYRHAIEKCELLIATHPKSKWVDDAILMMGKAFYFREEYDEAITKFDELQINFPRSELNEEGQFYLGQAYADKGQHERAISVLEDFVDKWPNSRYSAEVFYCIGTSLIKVGRDDEAIDYLELMAVMSHDNKFVVNAYLEIATQHMDNGDYQKALEIYWDLAKRDLNKAQRIKRLAGVSRAYVATGRYEDALRSSSNLTNNFIDLSMEQRATQRLLQGRALAGVDSIGAAIDRLEAVEADYPKSKFAAEAAYRLGVIYQDDLDSLDLARKYFDQVPKHYAKSPFAQQAIERSSSITRLQKIAAAAESGDDEGKALAKFNTAEIEYFQFGNTAKALKAYEELLDQYPNSEYAPRAAYAIAYIYQTDLGDAKKAQEAFQQVVARYPASQQAEFARTELQRYTDQLEQSKRD